MKYRKLILIGILFFTYINSCKAQSKIQTQQTYSTEIIGTWENNDEAGHKLEFLSNGRLKIYSENELVGTLNYAVVITCNGHTMTDRRIYLSLEDEDGDVSCETLEAVNNNNSGILSMTTEQGKLQVYNRVN